MAELMSAMRAAVWPWPLLAALLVAGPALWHALRVRRLRTVFVSYRRSDSATPTAALAAELRHHFGRRVFHDVASLRPGEPFRGAIARMLWRCDAVLVMIGPDWCTVAASDGRPRLWTADDVVRSEVGTALASGALVVPVLVAGADMPRAEQLPPDLHPMLALNALRMPEGDDAATVAALNGAIRAAPLRQTAGFLAACHAAVLVQLLVFGLAGGLFDNELFSALGVALPSFAAVAAAVALQHWWPSGPARGPWAAPLTLGLPLGFVAAVALLVLLRSLNLLGSESFQPWLMAVATVFAVYSGGVLVTLRENRSSR